MIWLTWRQFRVQAMVAAAAFVVLAAVLAYTGPHLFHLYDTSGIAQCRSGTGDCSSLLNDFSARYPVLHSVGALLIALPGIVGVFWGAPLLARELEAGTHRVAWTQSVTRTRWLATKVLVVGGACVVTTAAFTAVISWWRYPFDEAFPNRFAPGVFAQRGIVPLGYAAFAFALGIAMGAIFRRTVPAMGSTLAIFFATRFAIQEWVRPSLAAPLHIVGGSNAARGLRIDPNAWVMSDKLVDPSGHTIRQLDNLAVSSCHLTRQTFSDAALRSCMHRLGIRDVLTVQPANRFWPFQIGETAIYAALAIALLALAFWWVRRRIT